MRLIILPTCVSSPCSRFKASSGLIAMSALCFAAATDCVYYNIQLLQSLSQNISNCQALLGLRKFRPNYPRVAFILQDWTGGRDYVINLLERGRAGWSFRDIITQNCFICGDLNSRYEAGLQDWQLTRFSLLCVRSGLGSLGRHVVTVCWSVSSLDVVVTTCDLMDPEQPAATVSVHCNWE